MGPVLFVNIMLCVLVIAFNLFVLETADFNFQFISAICDIVSMPALTFAYCFLSEMLTTNLEDIAMIFYVSPWQHLPAKQQILLIYPIQRGQSTFRLKGLDLVECSLAVFTAVHYKLLCKSADKF